MKKLWRRYHKCEQDGFTLVELVVVIPSMAIIIATMAALMVTLYTDLLKKNGQLELEISAQNALFAMRDDPFFAIRFAGTNQDDTTDAYDPSGGWNAVDDNALIVYEASFNANREIASRSLVYVRDQPHACNSPDLSENVYSLNTLIYFVSANKLYRRVLIPNQANNCIATFRKHTCPQANASASCPADVMIAENVQTFSVSYFDKDGVQLNAASLESNPDLFIQAKRVDISLTLSQLVAADPITASASISIRKVE